MIKFKRQDGGSSSDSQASPPSSLAYGEPAIASDGTFYVGNGSGGVASKVKNSDHSENSKKAEHATEADHSSKSDNATNSDHASYADDAKNGQWEFLGTYKLDAWTGSSSPFSQTVEVLPVYGEVVMTATARLSNPMTEQTNSFDTNEKKLEALGLINAGKCTPGEGTVTIQCNEKPTCDIDVHWYVNFSEE